MLPIKIFAGFQLKIRKEKTAPEIAKETQAEKTLPDKIKKTKKDKEEIKTLVTDTTMSLKEFVDWCGKSNHRHIQIIGNWADTIEPDFQTKAQWEAFIKRNVRTAKNLEPFGDEKIIQGFKKIQEAVKEGWLKKYTLETLFKFIV